jgi:regulator of sigma E protease
METFLIKAAQLILAFAILVIIHEFGHFLFARIFGVRVEKFYIFFNPWFSLFKWKPKRLRELEAEEERAANGENSHEAAQGEPQTAVPKKRRGSFWGETQYGIGWLPLGGYCKIAGMIDESMDTEQMAREPQSWEFRSKPAWQRLLIMVAGVLFNFILAILIYAGIVFTSGEKYVPLNAATDGMLFSEAAHAAGFRDGDRPLYADGTPLTEPSEARTRMIQAKTVTVLRGVDTVDIAIPEKFLFALDEESKDSSAPFKFMTYSFPARVTQVAAGEGAEKAGLKIGDDIVAIDSVATPDILSFLTTLEGHSGKQITATVLRDNAAGAKDTLMLPIRLNSASKMGIGLELDPSAFFKYEEKEYGVFESIPRGIELGVNKLTSYVGSLKLVFTKEGAQSIGGFGAIGSIFPEKWNWLAFWNIAAFLSVALAFMNILPIPALDGGHVLFLLYEVITRRQPSVKFMEKAQMVGMAILLVLLLYANGMDIIRLFK